MSTNNIGDTASRLNALNATSGNLAEPSNATTGGPSAQVGNSNHVALNRERGIPAPLYNKQSLISSYLTREKDSSGQPGEQGLNNNPNKQINNNPTQSKGNATESGTITQKNGNDPKQSQNNGESSKNPPSNAAEKGNTKHTQDAITIDDCLSTTENRYIEEFGGTTILPKIKKTNPAMGEEERKKLLHEYQIRLAEHNLLLKESAKLAGIPLVDPSSTIIEDGSTSLPNGSFEEGGLSFDFGKAPDASSLGLPLYFHKNMQVLQGSLPLTIFNKDWQQAASDNHTDYKKNDKEVEKYRGHPYPGEWSQSRFKWNENFDNLVETCRKVYKYAKFANALEVHKRNVIRIFKDQRSWVIAFRYDLTIRKATFAVRNPTDKIPNPALEPSGLVDEVYYSARAQGDLNSDDNPYRKGGPKFGRNPYADTTTDLNPTQSNHYVSVAGPSRQNNTGRNQAKNQGPYGNYRGKNFNPSYKRPDGTKLDGLKGKGKERR
ncbi:uncharacterized protein MELLADRAFT_60269 [Melampsora larici-populina 98AG31]|uniref:Uncharacterized protein n=1 Tax=Melampsora larici-populina (strain 98AG31 / pathotype 3-4-7) TaxID=747676 RepID=F4RAQ4_MELLP|nr:uncharacterized protein MELLADRAFT_60269 [Melampsora larici-populina 98AG31]EGG10743.1 hypothetical protein MELLADRAFT_60269 [Melampsora larici-populina 98AG31]